MRLAERGDRDAVGRRSPGTFLDVQPLVGALLGVVWLGERFTAFTATGGALIVAGLWLALTSRPASR